ncbi:MAG: Ig-like domain-containing protein, partial [Myroides sp.]
MKQKVLFFLLFCFTVLIRQGIHAQTQSASAGNVKMYYTTASGTPTQDALMSAELSGANALQLASGASNFEQPGSVAVDKANGYIYVGDSHYTTGKGLIRYNLDGTGRTVIIPPPGNAITVGLTGIALDLINNKIYYSEASSTANLNAVKRANLDGSNVETLAAGANNFERPGNIALDIANGYLYVIDTHFLSGKGLLRYNLDGTGRTVIVPHPGNGANVGFVGIALDLTNGKIYFTQASSTASLDVIKRVNIDGSGMQTLVTHDMGTGTNSNFTQPGDLVLDKANGHMYLADTHFTDGKGIIRYNLDGTGRTVVVAHPGNQSSVSFSSITLDNEYLPSSNTAPTASSVTNTGTLTVGQMLTGAYTYTDAENNPEMGSTFKWYRSDDASGTNKTVIASATAVTYTLTAADAGKYISFEVTPSDGNTVGTAVESDRLGIYSPASTLTFNGTDQYVNVPNDAKLEFVTGTIEMWVKPGWNIRSSITDPNPTLISMREGGSSRFSIHMGGTYDRIGLYSSNGGWQQIPYTFQKDSWYHIAFVLNTNSTRVYINGQFITNVSSFIAPSITGKALKIGTSDITLPEFFKGELDDIRIWNTIRTASEIKANYSTSIASGTTGLVALYTILPGITDDSNKVAKLFADSSPNTLNGTLENYWFENSSPIITTSNNSTDFTEGTIVAVDNAITVTDADNSTLFSAKVSITGNFHSAEDVLGFTNNGSTMGNIAGSYDAATGILSMTSSGALATLAQWQSALRAVTYSNNSNNPHTANRIINFVVNDGTVNSNVAAKTVTVTAVYNAPTISISNISTSINQGEYYEYTPVVTNPENGNLLFDTVNLPGWLTVDVTTGRIYGTPGQSDVGAYPFPGFIRVSDDNGISWIWSGDFYITVTDVNDAPTNIIISNDSVDENVAGNTQIGALSTEDIDPFDVHTYSLVSGTGDTDNASFSINGNILYINQSPDYETKNSYSVRIRTTDNGGLWYEKSFTIHVNNVNEAPVISAPAFITVIQGQKTAISGISFSDADAGNADVTVNISAASGSLSAISGAGVTVTGTSSDLILTGNIVAVNAFIVGNNLTFTSPAASLANIILSVEINDNGNTGSGGLKTDLKTVTLNILDQTAPTINSVSVPLNGTYKAGDDLSFAVNFDESVTIDSSGGNPQLVLTVGNDTRYAMYIGGSGTSVLTFIYTAELRDFDDDGINVGTLSLNGGTIKDAAQNNAEITLNNIGNTDAVLIDAVAPKVNSISRVTSEITNQTTVEYLVIFSENVSGVDSADFTLTSMGSVTGTITGLIGSGNSYNVTVSDITGDGTLRLDLNPLGTAIFDAAGNGIISGFVMGQTYTIDQTGPTLTISSDRNTLKVGETAAITFTFSEDPGNTFSWNGSVGNIVVSGGTMSAISGTGLTRTATFTPTENINNGTGNISVPAGNYTDTAGNTGTEAVLENIIYDTQIPTATIVVADDVLSIGETSLVTITFNETVSGFDNTYLTISNGTLSTMISVDGGITWTAIFTPTANIEVAFNTVILDNTRIVDLAGNTGFGASVSNNYEIDTKAPVPAVASLPTIIKECSVTSVDIPVPTATDNSVEAITATTTDALAYTQQGTYTINWTYNDGNGNTTTQQQTIVVDDVTAPVPAVASLPTITKECAVTAADIPVPTANDNCAGSITATTTDALTYTEQGTYTINWTYNDGNGNTATQQQTIVV